jgi:2-polyprenyl-3-methyl-5-hydroxy-6-metoxy-1,4-benzoquinol methylase
MYESKGQEYFTLCRMDMLEAIPGNGKNKILEIGAGSGETLLKAKALGLAEEVVGVELVRLGNGKQSHPAIDRFIIGDVEQMDLPLEQNYFDVVLCGDVLEHLTDPWKTVKKLSTYLKPNGYFIASIPNIREIKTLLKIVLHGDFNYNVAGILDKTHLRFFCKKNMLALFEQSGLTVISIKSNLDILGKGKRVLLNKLTFRFFSEFLEGEYLLVAQKEKK